jgi:hypothetical protein
MTYRRFLAWLQNGPALLRFEQGKGDLQFADPEPVQANTLGLPNLDDLAPPARTAARLPAAASSLPAPQAFK